MSVIIKSDIESIDVMRYDSVFLKSDWFHHYSYSRNSLLETGYLVVWI